LRFVGNLGEGDTDGDRLKLTSAAALGQLSPARARLYLPLSDHNPGATAVSDFADSQVARLRALQECKAKASLPLEERARSSGVTTTTKPAAFTWWTR